MRDIENIDDIKVFVNSFYAKVQKDELLAPVFAMRIGPDDWPKHLERLYAFWNTVLFFEPGFKGQPFGKHVGLPIEGHHFQHWAALFKENMDQHFEGDMANDAKRRVDSMAALFAAKMEHIRKNPNYYPLK